ncbi:MAG TPA: hypothetical protein VLF89_07280 [Candidatus Saccharimonadales bacterium]|nr:hypothetical protein [Candidatus Saccharimonadales bacterium]
MNIGTTTPGSDNPGNAGTGLSIEPSSGVPTLLMKAAAQGVPQIYFGNINGFNGGLLFNSGTTGSANDLTFFTGGTFSGNAHLDLDSTGNLSVGAINGIIPLATLDTRAVSGTLPIASFSGQTSFAGLVVDNKGTGDLFTASSSGASRFVITQAGNVGIGTTNPSTALQIVGGGCVTTSANCGINSGEFRVTGPGGTMDFRASGGGIDWVSTNPIFVNNNANQNFYLVPGTSTGRVGVGTSSPLAKLDVRGITGTIPVASVSGTTSFASFVVNNDGVGDLFTASASSIPVFKIDTNGNTRIGGSLCVKGTLSSACAGNTAGTIYATNTTVQSADVAENYVSSQTLEPGDVIMPASDGNNQAVIKTTSAYQSQTIGIVSTKPGVTLNSDAQKDVQHPNLYPIALQGRVPVKVSTMNGDIHTGDLLTSSSVPGVAMKATKAGQIIGKALEEYTNTDSKTDGKIMVFVNISWSDPTTQIALTDTGDLSINGSTIADGQVLAQGNTGTPTQNAVTTQQFNDLSTTVTSLQSQIASMSSQISKIDDLSKQLTDLEKTVNINQALQQISTQSAVLGVSTQDTTVGGTLSVSGRTLLGEVGITGKVTDGLLSINGMDDSSGTPSAVINTLSAPLKIQSLALNSVDFENGKMTIDTNGNVVTQGDVTAKTVHADKINLKDSGDSAAVGESTIPAGQTSIEVITRSITDTSKVFVTLKTLEEATLVVTHQTSGKSFTVELTKPMNKDTKFNWWIVN